MGYAIRIKPGTKVRLEDIDTRKDGGLSRDEGETRFAALAKELGDLQELLYAAGTHALLVVLQGMDTSGKDGAIRGVFHDVDPQGIRAVPFGVPTRLELAHDFLWREHRETPEKGMIVVFNRSHYEAVLVERVKEIVPEPVWRPRYGFINDFERMLAAEGTVVLKFFLHISKDEQEERLIEREQDVAKAWKLNAGDWIERRNWDAYQQAYADAISATSTDAAPWFVVPADRKWFRNLAVAEAIVAALRPLRAGWLADLEARGARELALVREAREAERAGGAESAGGKRGRTG